MKTMILLAILTVASTNSILVFTIFNKWFRKLKEKVCIYCLMGWISICAGAILANELGHIGFVIFAFPIWAVSIMFYGFILMCFEHR